MSCLALYRAFEIGKMAVVAPLSASYPALTLILSWMTGDRLSGVRVVGIFCTLAGVAIVAAEKKRRRKRCRSHAEKRQGIGLAIFAAADSRFFSGCLQSRHSACGRGADGMDDSFNEHDANGSGTPRCQAAPAASARRRALDGPGMGALDTGAFVLSNLGMKMEQIAVISVLDHSTELLPLDSPPFFERTRFALAMAGNCHIFLGIFLISR